MMKMLRKYLRIGDFYRPMMKRHDSALATSSIYSYVLKYKDEMHNQAHDVTCFHGILSTAGSVREAASDCPPSVFLRAFFEWDRV